MRIDRTANRQAKPVGANADTLKAAGTPTVACPTVADKLPAVPAQSSAEMDRNLRLLDQQIAEANRRIAAARGQGGPNLVDNAVLSPLRAKRVATLDRIGITIGRHGSRPTGLVSLADCDPSYDGAHPSHSGSNGTGAPAPAADAMTPTVNFPTVRDRLPAVPAGAVDEVNRNLALLDRQIAESNQRIVTAQGQGGPNFIDNAILDPLRAKRVATLDRITIAVGRQGTRPTGLAALAPCTLNTSGNRPWAGPDRNFEPHGRRTAGPG